MGWKNVIGSAGRIRLAARAMVVFAAFVLASTVASQPGDSSDKVLFLVATPELPDPFFGESVVLMVPVKETPLVVGLIVNKPTRMVLRKLFPDSSALKSNTDRAYFGGPVAPTEPAIVLRARGPLREATHLADDVYVSLEAQSVLGLLSDAKLSSDLRIFLGRAQWTRSQLRGEMARGSWYAVPAETSLIFSANPGGLWRILVERARLERASATSGCGAGPLPILLDEGGNPGRLTQCSRSLALRAGLFCCPSLEG